MKNSASAFSLGCLLLGLSLLGSISYADAPQPTLHNSDLQAAYSAAALYNLGNSYAREGKPALAVLAYERARLLAPLDPDIKANLRHVRDSVSLSAIPNKFDENFRLMSPNTTYWFGLTGLIFAGVSGLLLALKMSPRVLSGAALGGGMLMVAYALSDAAVTAHLMREAVVMQSASACAAPIANAEALFTLPPATVVRIQDEHGNFLLIRDPHGKVGWVPRNMITPVIIPEGNFHA